MKTHLFFNTPDVVIMTSHLVKTNLPEGLEHAVIQSITFVLSLFKLIMEMVSWKALSLWNVGRETGLHPGSTAEHHAYSLSHLDAVYLCESTYWHGFRGLQETGEPGRNPFSSGRDQGPWSCEKAILVPATMKHSLLCSISKYWAVQSFHFKLKRHGDQQRWEYGKANPTNTKLLRWFVSSSNNRIITQTQ